MIIRIQCGFLIQKLRGEGREPKDLNSVIKRFYKFAKLKKNSLM